MLFPLSLPLLSCGKLCTLYMCCRLLSIPFRIIFLDLKIILHTCLWLISSCLPGAAVDADKFFHTAYGIECKQRKGLPGSGRALQCRSSIAHHYGCCWPLQTAHRGGLLWWVPVLMSWWNCACCCRCAWTWPSQASWTLQLVLLPDIKKVGMRLDFRSFVLLWLCCYPTAAFWKVPLSSRPSLKACGLVSCMYISCILGMHFQRFSDKLIPFRLRPESGERANHPWNSVSILSTSSA